MAGILRASGRTGPMEEDKGKEKKDWNKIDNAHDQARPTKACLKREQLPF
jgi:hypothetical protein